MKHIKSRKRFEDEYLDKFAPKTTEAELNSNWIQWGFDPVDDDDDDREDPFKVGELVETPDGSKARIKECNGKNAFGIFEYYVEYCIPTRNGEYFTERELIRPNDAPPPAPKSEKLEVIKCDHKNAYRNSMPFGGEVFWVCPDCKEEVEDPNKLSRAEFDEMLDEFERFFK